MKTKSNPSREAFNSPRIAGPAVDPLEIVDLRQRVSEIALGERSALVSNARIEAAIDGWLRALGIGVEGPRRDPSGEDESRFRGIFDQRRE